MEGRTMSRRFVAVVGAVLILGAVFVVVSGAVGADEWAQVASILILVSMALVAIVTVRKRSKEMRSGFPKEDERSMAVKMRAGYISFFISLYLLLGMGFALSVFEDDQASSFPMPELLMITVGMMGSIFLVVNTYLGRKGVSQ